MKTIIVATDFSPAALNATDYAADMAIAVNAELLLLNTFQLPVAYSEVPLVMDLGEIQINIKKELEELKALLEKRNDRLRVNMAFRLGSFYTGLKEVCEQINPYAVVMGSQGTTAAERVFFGGHSIHAMKHLEWPLITVPPSAKFSDIRKIGLACEFKEPISSIPINEIKTLMKDFNAELHVLNIEKQEVYNPDIVFESGLLQELLAPFKPNYHLISSENTDEGILNFAEKIQVDLLIILPKKHGLVDTLIHKSHTKQFVLHSHIPVMSLHQQ